MKKLPESARKSVVKIFKDYMLKSLIEYENPKEAAQKIIDTLPWVPGETDSAAAMNQGIREAAVSILSGGSHYEI